MANELQAQTYQTTGTVYARLWDATNQYWYTVTPAFEAFNAAHIADYDLAATLASGQAFRWDARDDAWVGVIGQRWVRLKAAKDSLTAETASGQVVAFTF